MCKVRQTLPSFVWQIVNVKKNPGTKPVIFYGFDLWYNSSHMFVSQENVRCNFLGVKTSSKLDKVYELYELRSFMVLDITITVSGILIFLN